MGTDPNGSRASSSDAAGGRFSRRQFLAVQSLVLAGAATGSATAQEGDGGEESDGTVANAVALTPGEQRDDPVSDGLFGRLSEHYESGTIYPGIYSEHVKNPTFYPRSYSEDDFFGPRTFYPAEDIDQAEGVPFPWEPVGDDGVTFESPEGGVAAVDSTVYQRVHLDGARGGITQKVVLPDFRTHGYDLSVSVRGEGVETVRAALTTVDGEELAATTVPVGEEWDRQEVTLELDEPSGDQYVAGGTNVDTPYGQYAVEFTAEGSGRVDLDWVSLAADDAVRGKFNPNTVELMREQDVTWLKWPGGNFTSQYNWRDGVGPQNERPARFNHAWGGVNPNLFGTVEYLELCEIADLTPRFTIGWWDNPPEWASERQILPEDAADWVEYVNGSADTEMGALRAENGREEPWDVTHWEVGNEVWGPWQRGSTQDASEYASGSEQRIGFTTYYDAMKAVDEDIRIYADAMDPGYNEANTPDPDVWNETLFEEAGDRLDGFDLHRYNWGIEDPQARQDWYDDNDAGPLDYNEVLTMFPTQFGQLMAELSEKAAEAGVEDFRVNVGEYGMFPAVDAGAPYPGPETMPGGAYIAGMLNAFVRRSETVKEASQTWWPVRMFPPIDEEAPPDPNPLSPAGTVTALYGALLSGDTEWRAVDVDVSGDGRTIPETGPRVRRMEDVPYVDAAGVAAETGDLATFLTNRNLRTESETTVEFGEDRAGAAVQVTAVVPSSDQRPLPHLFGASWAAPTNYVVETSVESVADDGTLALTLPPAAVVRCYVDANGRGGVADDGVWHGISTEADGEPYHEDFAGGGYERAGSGGGPPGNGKGNGNGPGQNNGNGPGENNGNGNGENDGDGNGRGNESDGDDEEGDED